MIPDVISMNIDDARHKIYETNPEIQIHIMETANRKKIKYLMYNISDAIVIKQQLNGSIVELTVAYTALQL